MNLGIIVGLLVWTGFVLYFCLFIDHFELRNKKFNRTFGELYQTLFYKRQDAMLYPISFLVKRLFFVLIMRNDNFFVFKFALLWCMQNVWTIYLVGVKPIFDKDIQYLEVFNEYVLTCILMLLPLFTDYVPSSRA
jgi:hypothetical protein